MNSINLFKNFEQKENFEHGLPQSKETVQNLEILLNVKFSESYKELLYRYGYIAWFGGCIYGPSDNDFYNLLTRNKEFREAEAALPKNFRKAPRDAFLIKDYGEAYFMLYSEDSLKPGKVGFFLGETGYREEETWESLEGFLEDYYG